VVRHKERWVHKRSGDDIRIDKRREKRGAEYSGEEREGEEDKKSEVR
jgi:hypothetical protein